MSGQPETQKLQALIKLPADFGQDTANELRQLRAEIYQLRELLKTAVGKLFWSEEELARDFGISLKSQREERRAAKIGYKRVKGKIVYSRKHIEDYLNSGN